MDDQVKGRDPRKDTVRIDIMELDEVHKRKPVKPTKDGRKQQAINGNGR